MTSRYGSPAELCGAMIARPGAGGGAHKLNDVSEIGVSNYAADLPRSSSRSALAGPDRVPPLGGRGNPYGPAVSTAGLTRAASVAFGRAGGVFFQNLDVSASPCLAADDAAHDGAEGLPCIGFAHTHEGRSKHGREVAQVVSGRTQNVGCH